MGNSWSEHACAKLINVALMQAFLGSTQLAGSWIRLDFDECSCGAAGHNFVCHLITVVREYSGGFPVQHRVLLICGHLPAGAIFVTSCDSIDCTMLDS